MMCVKNITNQCFLMLTGIKYLSEANINELVNLGPNQFKNNGQLLCALYQVFSSPEALGNSFIRTQECKEDLLELVDNDVKTVFPSAKEKVSTFKCFAFIHTLIWKFNSCVKWKSKKK